MSCPSATFVNTLQHTGQRQWNPEPGARLAMVLNSVALGALISLTNRVTHQVLAGDTVAAGNDHHGKPVSSQRLRVSRPAGQPGRECLVGPR